VWPTKSGPPGVLDELGWLEGQRVLATVAVGQPKLKQIKAAKLREMDFWVGD
jgi:hypothetical protein